MTAEILGLTTSNLEAVHTAEAKMLNISEPTGRRNNAMANITDEKSKAHGVHS